MSTGIFVGPGATAQAAARVAPQKKNPLEQVLDILGSKGGQTLVNAAGAGLSAYGANKNASEARAQSARQFQAEMEQRQFENAQANQRQRAIAAQNASPLGTEQSFAQRQALLGSILPGLRNVRSTPGDPGIASAMGSREGGLRLPEGGLDPNMISRLFGDEATLASLAQHGKQIGQINPNGPTMDLTSLYGDAAEGTMGDITSANQAEFARQQEEEARTRALIQRAIDEDIRGEKQKQKKKGGGIGGFFKKLGKIATVAAPIVAAPFTGGASLAAIGAASGAANSLLNGGGAKGALLGGAMGAIPIPGAKGAGARTMGNIAKTAAKNPQLYSAILGSMR